MPVTRDNFYEKLYMQEPIPPGHYKEHSTGKILKIPVDIRHIMRKLYDGTYSGGFTLALRRAPHNDITAHEVVALLEHIENLENEIIALNEKIYL